MWPASPSGGSPAGDASSAREGRSPLEQGRRRAPSFRDERARPSSSRSDGRGGRRRPVRPDMAARDLQQAAGGPCERPAKSASSPRVEVGLARKLGIEPLEASARLRRAAPARRPRARRERDLTTEQLQCAAWSSSSVEASPPPEARARPRTSRPASSPGQRPAPRTAGRDRPRATTSDAGSGRRGQAAARLRPARRLLELQRDLLVGPQLRLARCHARRSGSTVRSVASARARWTSRRCSLVAVR